MFNNIVEFLGVRGVKAEKTALFKKHREADFACFKTSVTRILRFSRHTRVYRTWHGRGYGFWVGSYILKTYTYPTAIYFKIDIQGLKVICVLRVGSRLTSFYVILWFYTIHSADIVRCIHFIGRRHYFVHCKWIKNI